MVYEDLKQLIEEGLERIDIKDVDFTLERPADNAHGDYATNVALIVAKKLDRKPREVAEAMATFIQKKKPDPVNRIEVAGPGFINIWLAPKYFGELLGTVLRREDHFGHSSDLLNEKVMVEYTDPNPFKVFHIGHLMSNTVGESLSRLFARAGAEVMRVCYQGDVGMHVAKAVWGMAQKKDEIPENDAPLSVRLQFLQDAYLRGIKAYEDDGNAQEEIRAVNKLIFAHVQNGEVNDYSDVYNSGRAWSLEHFEEIYKLLGTHHDKKGNKAFNHYFFESNTGTRGKELVLEWLEKGLFEKSQGAVVFRGEDIGLHTRVFLNSDGLPTYEAKELGLAKEKYDTWPYDYSFVVTGNEINEYFKVLLAVMKQVFPKLADKTEHIGHGMLRLTTGKMSSRKGNVVTGENLINDTRARALEKMKERDLLEQEREDAADAIAVSAIKYQILKQAAGKDVTYDPESALSFEGDSGPYLQYTYARARSVLRNALEKDLRPTDKLSSLLDVPYVVRLLEYFPEVVQHARIERSPHYIATYLTDLAREFNSYYASHPIIDAGDEAQTRLTITAAVAQVIKNGLDVLGIRALERM